MPTFISTDTNPAVVGENTDNGIGVLGTSVQNDAVHGNTSSPNAAGVSGFNTKTDAPAGPGVLGVSVMGVGVHGHSSSSAGVVGDSDAFDGIEGTTRSNIAAGVSGHNDNGNGVLGDSKTGRGVFGNSVSGDAVFGNATSGRGVVGQSNSQAGVVGVSQTFDGVYGISDNPAAAGVSGHNPGGLAGFFEGNVTVTGLLNGAAIGPELVQRVSSLEQQVHSLTTRVASLEATQRGDEQTVAVLQLAVERIIGALNALGISV